VLVVLALILLVRPSRGQGQVGHVPTRDSITLYVRTEDGRALADAIVEVRPSATGTNGYAKGNVSGRVVFLRPRTDTVRLRVRASGFDTASVLVRLDTVRLPLLVTMRPTTLLLPPVCTANVAPAISLSRDSQSARDTTLVTLRVRDGTFEQVATVRLRDWQYNKDFARERAGTYDIEARALGYGTWRRTGIKVQKDICHVATKTFRVLLVPRR
jgi:hypothetical protein